MANLYLDKVYSTVLLKWVSKVGVNTPGLEHALSDKPPAWLHGPLTSAGSAAGGWRRVDMSACGTRDRNHESTDKVSDEGEERIILINFADIKLIISVTHILNI